MASRKTKSKQTFFPSNLIILAKAYSAQKPSTLISVVKNTKERESVLKSTQASDRQKKHVAYQEDKPNKGSTGGNDSGYCRMNIGLNRTLWKVSELVASPATHMENSSCGVACIKNDGKDRSIRGLWIKKE